ncbi:MAG TPA: DUF2852 domain-containing protein [Acetobacteraceae bacterium]
MSGTASHGTYDSSPWYGGAPGGWGGVPPWFRAPWLRQLDSKPVWIVLTVLGFIHWWPIGLALLIFLIGSGRMGCGFGRRNGEWRARRWACGGNAPASERPGSGNRAFDEYRADTLRRLEQEQQDFAAFLDRLRFARDKSEFDAFMEERRRPPEQPEPAPGA